jgi:SOS response regulatory protein OraA/RecX
MMQLMKPPQSHVLSQALPFVVVISCALQAASAAEITQDFRGRPYDPANGPAAHPNSRFTVAARQNPGYSKMADAPIMENVQHAIAAIVSNFVDAGVIDDKAFAQTKARALHRRGTSSRLTRQKLKLAGIDGETAKIKGLRSAERYLPDNIYDAIANFRKAEWVTTLLGKDVQGRYADLKQASADRCPRLLGTFVKAQEVQYHHDVYNQFLWNLF